MNGRAMYAWWEFSELSRRKQWASVLALRLVENGGGRSKAYDAAQGPLCAAEGAVVRIGQGWGCLVMRHVAEWGVGVLKDVKQCME